MARRAAQRPVATRGRRSPDRSAPRRGAAARPRSSRCSGDSRGRRLLGTRGTACAAAAAALVRAVPEVSHGRACQAANGLVVPVGLAAVPDAVLVEAGPTVLGAPSAEVEPEEYADEQDEPQPRIHYC